MALRPDGAGCWRLQYGWRLGLAHEEARGRLRGGAAARGAGRRRALAGDPAQRLRGGAAASATATCASSRACSAQAIALAEASDDPALYMADRARAPTRSSAPAPTARRSRLSTARSSWRAATRRVGGGVNYACPYAWCHGFKGMVLVDPGRARGGPAPDRPGAGAIAARAGRRRGRRLQPSVRRPTSRYFAGEPEAALRHARRRRRDRRAHRRRRSRACSGGSASAWPSRCGASGSGRSRRSSGRWRSPWRAGRRSSRTSCWARPTWPSATPGRRGRSSRGLDVARAQGNVFNEMLDLLALARVLLGPGDDDLLARPRRRSPRPRAWRARRARAACRAARPRRARRAGAPAGRRGGLRAGAPRGAPGLRRRGAHGRARDASAALAASGP